MAFATTWAGPRRPVVAVYAAVIVGVSVGIYVLIRVASPHHEPPRSPVAASQPVGQAEAWIKANLPHGAPLSAEASVAAALGDAGFSAHTFPAGGRWDTDRFLVSTPAIRGAITRDLAASAARISSAPVAVFGPAAGRVEIRMIVPGSVSDLNHRVAQDAHDRLAAGHALLANARVTADPEPHAFLDSGKLDLRAAVTLALLATRTDVHITRIALAEPEARAGRPARTMTLSLANGNVLAETRRMLPNGYAPSNMSEPVGGSRELTWSVGLAPPGFTS